jgi:hypothetical protein
LFQAILNRKRVRQVFCRTSTSEFIYFNLKIWDAEVRPTIAPYNFQNYVEAYLPPWPASVRTVIAVCLLHVYTYIPLWLFDVISRTCNPPPPLLRTVSVHYLCCYLCAITPVEARRN